jgi:hypothetical protein
VTFSDTDEGRTRRPDSAQSARADSVVLGLLPAPELPTQIAEQLADELPELLSRHVDDRVSWEVSVVSDPLTGTEPNAVEVVDVGCERRQEEGWDLAICITDLPIRNDGRAVVAALSTECKVAVVSLPPLGVTFLRRRVREATLQLVNELYEGNPEFGQDGEGVDAKSDAGKERRPGPRPDQLIGRRLTEIVSPIQRITSTGDDIVDVRFVSPKMRGYLRLLGGMVLANRPWRLFSTMKSTLAAAFATGAYALVTPSIWQLGDYLDWVRLLILMVLAIVAMVVWIIVAHNLWEKPTDREDRDQVALYNAATVLTLTVAVLFSYAVLFVLILVVAGIFVDKSFFQSILQHPVGLGDYMRLAWITASLATVAGALGSGLEDDETVRDATYGYRQWRRNQSESGSDTS